MKDMLPVQTGDANPDSTRNHVRGSSLMLAGRMLAIVINFATQLVIVRALTQDDFGAFAYALAMLTLGACVARLGMDKALSRFTPIYLEQGDLRRAAGIIVFVLLSITTIGGTLVAVTWLGKAWIDNLLHTEPITTSLVVFLAVLAPIEGLENALEKLLAILAKPKALFFRRHVLGPVLKLAAALPVLLFHSDVFLLAWLYLAARLAGLLVSGLLVGRELHRTGLSKHFVASRKELPAREVLGFSIPLLSNDVSFALRTSMVTFFIEFFHTAGMVAIYRAIVPVARLNLVVSDSFKLLYTPAAARLFAKNDRHGIESLFWNNTAWIALLTFPVFILTFTFAEPMTVTMFGERYRESGRILSLVALGTYVNAAFGFNIVTMRVLGHVRVLVWNDVFGITVAIILNLLLIPRFGALGAGLAVCSSNLIQNVVLQAMMFRLGILRGITTGCARVYASIAILTIGVWSVEFWISDSLVVGLICATLAGVAAVRLNARSLGIGSVFPELRRIAPFRLLLGISGEAAA